MARRAMDPATRPPSGRSLGLPTGVYFGRGPGQRSARVAAMFDSLHVAHETLSPRRPLDRSGLAATLDRRSFPGLLSCLLRRPSIGWSSVIQARFGRHRARPRFNTRGAGRCGGRSAPRGLTSSAPIDPARPAYGIRVSVEAAAACKPTTARVRTSYAASPRLLRCQAAVRSISRGHRQPREECCREHEFKGAQNSSRPAVSCSPRPCPLGAAVVGRRATCVRARLVGAMGKRRWGRAREPRVHSVAAPGDTRGGPPTARRK